MKTFNEWVNEADGQIPGNPAPRPTDDSPMPTASDPAQNPPAPTADQAGNVDEMQIRGMLKTRVGQMMDELKGYKMGPQKAMQLIQAILQEFQAETGLTRGQIGRAARTVPQSVPMQ